MHDAFSSPGATRVTLFLIGLALPACTNDNGESAEPLDPSSIPQFVQPLTVPTVMPPTGTDGDTTEYRIAARQIEQQILPEPMPTTTLWAYGRDGDPLPAPGVTSTFQYPGATVELRTGNPVRVTWINGLVDDGGRFLPHLLPVDSTIHWADPGSESGHDHTDGSQTGYSGPVPIVTHVHGGHSFDHSDGHPEAWFLPNAVNIPEGFATRGPTYRSQSEPQPGEAVFEYPVDDRATTLWYHDHSLGMTRLNVYAGLAGLWIVRDEAEDALGLPGPPPVLGEPSGTRHYEIQLVVQDRDFYPDGSLFYPSSRQQFGDTDGPFVPDSSIPPTWNPEFLGHVMVVNGRAWPFIEVEPRLYRFRVLNACDSRTLILHFDRPELEIVQIGGDGGLLPDAPVRLSEPLVLGPAERIDLLIDFSALSDGDTTTLLNDGPDEAWGGPNAMPPQDPADPETTGRVMQFRVVARTDNGVAGAIPTTLAPIASLTTELPPRDVVLIEQDAPAGPDDDTQVPIHVMLGTASDGALPWSAPPTEIVGLGDTEIWRITNLTDDAHPIHLHLVQFRVLDRIPFDADGYGTAQDAWLAGTGPMPVLEDFVTGSAMPPLPEESGEKDTVMAWPGTITRIVARFDRAGNYVWHCHILEHEDNDMMRPLVIAE
jgi:FtsP/CotA-like multicopper oxidase with cupredoxin domain